jgi:hypothetical protein
MSATLRSLAETEEERVGAILLLPSLVSFLAAVFAWALTWAGERSVVPLGIVTVLQAALILFGAVVIADARAKALDRWCRRLAPSVAQRRVRQASLKLLAQLAARGLAGPLLMVAGIAWLRPGWDALALAAGVLAALTAMLLVGAWLGARLQRRVFAWAAAGWRSPSIWRALGGRWRQVPTEQQVDGSPAGSVLWICCVLVPQSLMQAQRWSFHAWGTAYTSGLDIACVSLWMLMLGGLINMWVIGPPLHWRMRLAPGGLSAAGWARRMVAGSLLNAVGWMSVALALGMAVSKPALRAEQLAAWAPAMADVVLAMAWALWLRSRRNNGFSVILAAVGLAAATVLPLLAAHALALAPRRGVIWLAVELTLALTFAVAAQRAWARHDLNRLAPRA